MKDCWKYLRRVVHCDGGFPADGRATSQSRVALPARRIARHDAPETIAGDRSGAVRMIRNAGVSSNGRIASSVMALCARSGSRVILAHLSRP